MKDNIFNIAKNIFLDTVNPQDYVELESISTFYRTLHACVLKPLKMVLLYGKPGTGKSMLLAKLHDELSQTQKVYLYKTPIIDESEFYKTLAQDLLSVNYEGELNFTQFIKILNNLLSKEVPIILLDEAQLYSNSLMEKIRLLSDTRKLKFVITLHKTDKEDLIAKEHFQTRIWESIELNNTSSEELKFYIHKKLLQASCLDVANMFNNNAVNLIYKLTKGNYRDSHKLLYTLLQIYSWYYEHSPSKIRHNKISTKIVEMAAMHVGLLDA